MTTTTVRGPADVIGLLPYQLGYHPHDAVVAVALADRRLGMIARIDLPPEGHRVDAAESLVEPLLREGAEGVVLIGYETEPGASVATLAEIERACDDAGLEVMDLIAVLGGHWRSLCCQKPCCAVPGRKLPEPSTIPAVAEYVGLGVAPMPDRSALEALVATDEDTSDVAAALETACPGGADGEVSSSPRGTGSRGVVSRRARTAWARLCELGDDAVTVDALSADEVALLAASLADVVWRDAVIARLCPGTLGPDQLPAEVARAVAAAIADRPWCEGEDHRARVIAGRRLLARIRAVARRVPPSAAPPLLTVHANLAWWCGDGSMARVALERALQIDPEYRLAQLLSQMIDHAIRPARAR